MLKKLSNSKVHWATNTIYVCWFGIPFSTAISAVLVYLRLVHTEWEMEKKDLPMDLFYSVLASLLSIVGQILLNLALRYEDAARIAIVKAVDVFFSFMLQYLFLNIHIDMTSVIGATSIIVGTFFVLVFKLLNDKYEDYRDKRNTRMDVADAAQAEEHNASTHNKMVKEKAATDPANKALLNHESGVVEEKVVVAAASHERKMSVKSSVLKLIFFKF